MNEQWFATTGSTTCGVTPHVARVVAVLRSFYNRPSFWPPRRIKISVQEALYANKFGNPAPAAVFPAPRTGTG